MNEGDWGTGGLEDWGIRAARSTGAGFALALFASFVTACGGARQAGTADAAPMPPSAGPPRAQSQEQVIPAGYGTLRENEITVSLRSGALLIKVTPLTE